MIKRWAMLVALMLFVVSGVQAGTLNCDSGPYTGTAVSTVAGTFCSYVDNTSGNSADFAGTTAGRPGGVFSNLPGMTVNTQVNFDSMPTGSFTSSNFYSSLTGNYSLTIQTTGVFSTFGVQNASGPADNPAMGAATASPGEGPSAGGTNNILGPGRAYNSNVDRTTEGTVTFIFNNTFGVNAFGLFLIDLNNAFGINPDTLSFYSSRTVRDSTTLLATITAAQYDMGPRAGLPDAASNALYFMGLLSTSTPIYSVVFSASNMNPTFADFVALDSVQFAGPGGGQTLPEPSSLTLVFCGGLALVALRLRKRAAR